MCSSACNLRVRIRTGKSTVVQAVYGTRKRFSEGYKQSTQTKNRVLKQQWAGTSPQGPASTSQIFVQSSITLRHQVSSQELRQNVSSVNAGRASYVRPTYLNAGLIAANQIFSISTPLYELFGLIIDILCQNSLYKNSLSITNLPNFLKPKKNCTKLIDTRSISCPLKPVSF